jgi:hypothetical protein
MASPRNAKRLLLVSLLALVLTLVGAFAGAYAWLSTRVTPWGDSLIVGPAFTGAVDLGGGGGRITFYREDGVPTLDAPAWKGRGPFTMTFVWGFVIYHTPPGTLRGDGRQARPAGGP